MESYRLQRLESSWSASSAESSRFSHGQESSVVFRLPGEESPSAGKEDAATSSSPKEQSGTPEDSSADGQPVTAKDPSNYSDQDSAADNPDRPPKEASANEQGLQDAEYSTFEEFTPLPLRPSENFAQHQRSPKSSHLSVGRATSRMPIALESQALLSADDWKSQLIDNADVRRAFLLDRPLDAAHAGLAKPKGLPATSGTSSSEPSAGAQPKVQLHSPSQSSSHLSSSTSASPSTQNLQPLASAALKTAENSSVSTVRQATPPSLLNSVPASSPVAANAGSDNGLGQNVANGIQSALYSAEMNNPQHSRLPFRLSADVLSLRRGLRSHPISGVSTKVSAKATSSGGSPVANHPISKKVSDPAQELKERISSRESPEREPVSRQGLGADSASNGLSKSASSQRVHSPDQPIVKGVDFLNPTPSVSEATGQSPAAPSQIAPDNSPTTSTVEALPAAVLEQMERLRQSGRQHLRLALSLPGGQTLRLHLQLHGASVQVRFGTDDAQLRSQLEAGWGNIRRTAEARGIRVQAPVFESNASPNPGLASTTSHAASLNSPISLPSSFALNDSDSHLAETVQRIRRSLAGYA